MEIQGISDEDKVHTESTMTVDSSDDSMSFSRVLISGAGFLADSYDLFVINIAVDLMSKVSYDQELTTTLKSQVSLFHIVMSYSPCPRWMVRRIHFVIILAPIHFKSMGDSQNGQ